MGVPLIAARDALLAGRLSPMQAVILVEETRVLCADQRTLVTDQLLDDAGCTPGQFRNRARRAVIAADPAGAATRRETAKAGRLVEHWAEPDGHTDQRNLTPLCRRHHRLKTHTPWRYRRLPDGTTEWTDPRGRRWRDPPHRAMS